MPFDPMDPNGSSLFGNWFLPQQRTALGLPTPLAGLPNAAAVPDPSTAAYFASVDAQQKQLAAQRQPASQTTLPYAGPGMSMGMDDIGLTPQPLAGQQAAQDVRDRYTPPTPTPAQLPGYSPNDPSAFAALDYTAPAQSAPQGQAVPAAQGYPARPDAASDPQRERQGRLSQDKLDQLFAMLVPGESGGNPNAVNKTTGAAGLTQFMPGTLDAFLKSPEGQGLTREDYLRDPAVQRKASDWLAQQNNSVIEAVTGKAADPAILAAAHAIGAGGVSKLLANPDGNAVQSYGSTGQAALIRNNPGWGIKPDDTGAQAIQKIEAYYQRTSADKPQAGTAAPPQGARVEPASATVGGGQAQMDTTARDAGGVGSGPLPSQLPGMGPQPATASALPPLTMSDKMLAAAGQIMQGRDIVDGLGRGLSTYQQLGRQDVLDRFKIDQEQANTALLRQKLGLVGAQTQAATAGIDQKNRGLDIKQQSADTGQQNADTRSQAAGTAALTAAGRLGVMQERAKLAQQVHDDVLSGSTGFSQGVAKDNVAESKAIDNDTQAAGEDLQQIADIKGIISKQPMVVGNSAWSQGARFLADKLGIDVGVNPDANSLAQKLVTALQNQQGLANAKGIGGRITQQEFAQFKQGAGGLATRPEALNALLDTYQQAAQRRLAVSQSLAELRRDPAAFREALNPANGGLSAWRQRQIDGQNQARGITAAAGAQPQYAPNAAGQWQHTDPSTGLGFTVH